MLRPAFSVFGNGALFLQQAKEVWVINPLSYHLLHPAPWALSRY